MLLEHISLLKNNNDKLMDIYLETQAGKLHRASNIGRASITYEVDKALTTRLGKLPSIAHHLPPPPPPACSYSRSNMWPAVASTSTTRWLSR